MKRNLLFILAVIMALCIFCSGVTVFAEPDESATVEETIQQTEYETEPESEPQEDTEVPTTEEEFVPSDYDTTEEETTRREPTQSATHAPTTIRKPTTTLKPTTTRKPVDNIDRDENDRNEQNEERVSTTSEEDVLPEGAFYVYLERNNGTPRLKAVLTKPELVTEPDTPVRPGFIFDGWYADPDFETKWSFYTMLAEKGTVIYAKWVPDPNAKVFKITVKQVEGGRIEINPAEASVNEPVIITVNPDDGMRLVTGSVTVNGKPTDVLTFQMPAENVVVSARFEEIPESEQQAEDKKSPLPFIIGAVIIFAIAGAVAFIILRRRDDFSEDEIDENGTIIDTDNDMSWVDESIVVEDGFKDGEKVIGNFIPENDFNFEFDEEDEEDDK